MVIGILSYRYSFTRFPFVISQTFEHAISVNN